MSQLRTSEGEDCEFKWGKKKGIGGKKKEVQFYESFTYDGEEYHLYDNVYLYKEDEQEPYIGKIVKIWEQPQQKKKVKILWFFRPDEILNWLEGVTTLENEILLASGDGQGLANVNPLEAISGKCHVVCTSKDSRNPQPSPEQLRMADYIFFRTFNVGNCTISDIIADKIAGVDVRCLLNREQAGHQSTGVLEVDPVQKEENGMTSNEVSQISSKLDSPRTLVSVMAGGMPGHLLMNKDESLKVPLNQNPLPGEDLNSNEDAETKEPEVPIIVQENVSLPKKKLLTPKSNSDNEVTTGSVSISQSEDAQLRSSNDLSVGDERPSKKARLDSSVKLPQEQSRSPSPAVHKERNENSVQKKQNVDTDENDFPQASGRIGSDYDDEEKSKPFKVPRRLEKGSQKKVKFDEKTSKPSNGMPHKATAIQDQENNQISEGKILEVTRRPDADRSKWFKGLPWKDRMQAAHEQGTLVRFENLDPAYSSAEIEDIVWSGFREYCTAKMVPHTAISSPLSGQAFVIFKSRDAADTAVRKLDEGCLMLPNGRPLVASWGSPPIAPGKPSAFSGHLVIDKIKMQMLKEDQRQAVSTSHCSQPNTIEYEMAMEWCLLQARAEKSWKNLYKQQGDELEKLKTNLKCK